MIGIVSAYNDVLSAHQPMADYPTIIKDEVRKHAAVAQFAGGMPAMCDGVTQGQAVQPLGLLPPLTLQAVHPTGFSPSLRSPWLVERMFRIHVG